MILKYSKKYYKCFIKRTSKYQTFVMTKLTFSKRYVTDRKRLILEHKLLPSKFKANNAIITKK